MFNSIRIEYLGLKEAVADLNDLLALKLLLLIAEDPCAIGTLIIIALLRAKDIVVLDVIPARLVHVIQQVVTLLEVARWQAFVLEVHVGIVEVLAVPVLKDPLVVNVVDSGLVPTD